MVWCHHLFPFLSLACTSGCQGSWVLAFFPPSPFKEHILLFFPCHAVSWCLDPLFGHYWSSFLEFKCPISHATIRMKTRRKWFCSTIVFWPMWDCVHLRSSHSQQQLDWGQAHLWKCSSLSPPRPIHLFYSLPLPFHKFIIWMSLQLRFALYHL